MKVLNLVYKDKSDIPYEVITFSDSQVHFRLIDPIYIENENVKIVSRFGWNDLQVILAAHAALREAFADNIYLYIPYFLGARSDRRFTIGGCNYIKDVVAPILNSLDLSLVRVLDPHSDVVEACITNLDKEDNVALVRWALEDIYSDKNPYADPFLLVSPDAGALKKVYHVTEQIGYTNEIIVASKHRDVKTGKILSTEVPLPSRITLEVHPKDFIILDDIADGARTFIEIAKVIKEKFPSAKVYLVVTHGIFSAGLYELSKYFETIYCTNSVSDIEAESYSDYTVDKNFVKQLNIF
jgi:ribose-phosphate pyrophosphokinase